MNNQLGVIFDMDGVLVDSYYAHLKSWQIVAEEEGHTLTEAQFALTFGRTSREIIASRWGEGLSEAQILDLDNRKEAAYRRIIQADFPAMPGVREMLRRLHEAGFALAIGSSGPPENVDLVLEQIQARSLFRAVVTGVDVTRGKPDPQVFLLAAQRLGIPADRCAVVEDAAWGIQAAHAAGMVAIGLTSTGTTRESLATADWVVGSLDELTPEQITRLIQRPTP